MTTRLARILRYATASLIATAIAASLPAQSLPDNAAKKPGTKRIGIVMPKSELGSGPSAGEPLREIEKQFLTGPGVEIVKVSALLPAQAYAEARQLECDYILTSSLTQKKSGSGGFTALRTLSAMAPVAYTVPGGGVAANMAAVTANQTLAAASVAAAGGVRAKSEVTLEFALTTADGAPVLSNTKKAKARTDGEDVITPLVRDAATAVISTVSSR